MYQRLLSTRVSIALIACSACSQGHTEPKSAVDEAPPSEIVPPRTDRHVVSRPETALRTSLPARPTSAPDRDAASHVYVEGDVIDGSLRPRYKLRGWSDLHAGAVLYSEGASGALTTLVELDQANAGESSRAPGIRGAELEAQVNEPDGGLDTVQLFASGFDLNRDGLGDAVIGISGGGNACEFLGSYYIIFANSDGTARASRAFGSCLTLTRVSPRPDGTLELRFFDGSCIYSAKRDGSVARVACPDSP
jgi:hypothetical protein